MSGPVFSSSIGHTLLSQSPRHAWTQHPALNPDYQPEESDVMDVGTAAHGLLLEGKDAVVVIDAPDYRTRAARDARDAARLAGQTPILAHRWAEVQAMVAAARTQLDAFDPPDWLADHAGMSEVSIFCELDGVAVRATPDWLSLDHTRIADYKTVSTSAHPAAFSRALWDRGYAMQHALYRRVVKQAHGTKAEFAFIVQETHPPYALSIVSLDPEAEELADQQLTEALRKWRQCLERNEWPGYPTRIAYAEVPGYLRAAWEMRAYYSPEEVTR